MPPTIRQSASLNLFYLGLLAVVGLAVNILIARFGGPTVLGQYVFLLTLAEAISKVATIGLNITLTQEFITDTTNTDSHHFAFHLDVAYATIMIGGGIALLFLMAGWLTPALVAATAVLLATKTILTTGYNFYGLSHHLFIFEIFQTLLFGLLILLMMQTVELSSSLLLMLLLVAILATLLLALAGLRSRVPLSFRPRLLLATYFRFLQKSIANNLYILFQYLIYRLDVLLLKPILGPAPLGIYSVATNLTEKLQMTTTALSTTHFASLIPLLKSNDENGARQLTNRTLAVGLGLNVLGTLFLIPLAWWLIPVLFGPAFGNVFTLMLFLIPGMLAITVSKVLYNYFILLGEAHPCLTASFIGIIVMVFGLTALLGRFGVIIAPIMSSITYLIVAAILFSFYRAKKTV